MHIQRNSLFACVLLRSSIAVSVCRSCELRGCSYNQNLPFLCCIMQALAKNEKVASSTSRMMALSSASIVVFAWLHGAHVGPPYSTHGSFCVRRCMRLF